MSMYWKWVSDASDERIAAIWKALGECDWKRTMWYDERNWISMDDYAEIIYGEMSKRGLLT